MDAALVEFIFEDDIETMQTELETNVVFSACKLKEL